MLGLLGMTAALLPAILQAHAASPDGSLVRNSLGMDFTQIEAGGFTMGRPDKNWDERPAHGVTVSSGFLFPALPVDNAQFETFEPAHKRYRGGADDDDPVQFVTYAEATAFCNWLSKKDGRSYRLPTEAEWEYVATTRPDAFADHGETENWCLDWYGPYPSDDQIDPIGYESGDTRVVRGGDCADGPALATYRLSELPDDRNAAVGFRVVIGPAPTGAPLIARQTPLWAQDVSPDPWNWTPTVPKDQSFFGEPIPFVRIPPHSNGPLFSKHNHDPALTYCDNGDLLAIWYTTKTEAGRELVVAGSRLRHGNAAWDPADLFWGVAGRNNHAPAIWNDGAGTIYHFNGLSAGEGWGDLIPLMRTSTDDGATWSPAQIIAPNYEHGNMPVPGVFRTKAGAICLP